MDDQKDIKKQVIHLGHKSDAQEIERIKEETSIERVWWGQKQPYQDYAAIAKAVEDNILVKVEQTQNYLPALRFRNSQLHHLYPPYLELHTKLLLDELTDKWRLQMELEGQNGHIRLAIANLVITEEYQKQLVENGKLAIIGNPHIRGVAFDIDASAYYLKDTPVNDRKTVKAKYNQKFEEAKAYIKAPEYLNFSKELTKTPLEILKKVLVEFKNQNKLNFVHEYPGTNNSSFHICRSPSYIPTNS